MTNLEAIEIMRAEQNCVQRNISGKCDRDCAHCDLLQDDVEIITAYDRAIAALEKQIPQKPAQVEPCNNGLRFGWCPSCPTSQVCETANYCKTCGQALDWKEGD